VALVILFYFILFLQGGGTCEVMAAILKVWLQTQSCKNVIPIWFEIANY